MLSNIFYFHPYLGKWSNWTNIFKWVETTNLILNLKSDSTIASWMHPVLNNFPIFPDITIGFCDRKDLGGWTLPQDGGWWELHVVECWGGSGFPHLLQGAFHAQASCQTNLSLDIMQDSSIFQSCWSLYTPPEMNTGTKLMVLKVYLLSNMVILGIYVELPVCINPYFFIQWDIERSLVLQ